MDFSQLKGFFESHDNFQVLTHKSPDGDTLGCGFALCYYLRNMGKKANVLNSEKLPARYEFMYDDYEEQKFEAISEYESEMASLESTRETTEEAPSDEVIAD